MKYMDVKNEQDIHFKEIKKYKDGTEVAIISHPEYGDRIELVIVSNHKDGITNISIRNIETGETVGVKDTVKIKVDTTELDCAIKKLKRLNKLVKKNKLPRVTISTHGNLDEKKIIELLDKYQWK